MLRDLANATEIYQNCAYEKCKDVSLNIFEQFFSHVSIAFQCEVGENITELYSFVC